MTITSTRINEIAEVAAEFYEKAIRNKLKTPDLASTKSGQDLITTVRLHDEQIQYPGVVDNGIPKDENGRTVSLQNWISIFTNYNAAWWLETFGDIAIEATENFQDWAKSSLEPELSDFNKIDERGRVYKSVEVISHSNGYRYDELHPITKQQIECPARGWQYDKHVLARKIADGDAQYVRGTVEGRVFLKDYLTA